MKVLNMLSDIQHALVETCGNKSAAARALGISRGKLLRTLVKGEDTPRKVMRLLFLDIETAPNVAYTWGMYNQNISIDQIVHPGHTLCLAAKWLGNPSVTYLSRPQDGEEGMAAGVWELMDQADAICTYNGKKFDLPVLRRDFVLHALPPPSYYHSIDLYRDVRSQFRFASNKLDFVAQQLGCGSKVQHKGMALWSGCMAGDEESWQQMESYNKQDVLLLEKLYWRIMPYIKQHPNCGFWFSESDSLICPMCGSENVTEGRIIHKQSQSYQSYVCGDCGTHSHARLRTGPAPKGILLPAKQQ